MDSFNRLLASSSPLFNIAIILIGRVDRVVGKGGGGRGEGEEEEGVGGSRHPFPTGILYSRATQCDRLS